MSGEGKNPQSSPVIAVTAKTADPKTEAVVSPAPGIGTAIAATSNQSMRAKATGGDIGTMVVNADGDASEKADIDSAVVENNEKQGDEADSEEDGKVTVKKDFINKLLEDYEAPKDDSIKEAFRAMVANYFVFKENYAVIKQEWEDKLKEMDPSLMDRIKSIDPTPENIAKTIIKSCADKCEPNKKPDVQADNTTSSPTLTPVSTRPDLTNGGTASPVDGESLPKKVMEAGQKFLSSLKKKITDFTSGANGTPDKDNTSSVAPVATSEQISEEVRRKADSKEKTPTDQSKVSDKAGINPETLTSWSIAEGKIEQLSNSSSTLDPSVGLPKTTAKPAAEPVMLMMKQHDAAAAAKSSGLPIPTTSDGPDGFSIGKPVVAYKSH